MKNNKIPQINNNVYTFTCKKKISCIYCEAYMEKQNGPLALSKNLKQNNRKKAVKRSKVN